MPLGRLALFAGALVFPVTLAAAPSAPASPAEEFYIVSSIDAGHQRIILRRPTEVTVAMRVTAATSFRDEAGRAIKLSDLHAGATAWIRTEAHGAELTALAVRLGPMTLDELRRRYLHLPAEGGRPPSASSSSAK
jgi:hypothetical protein